MTDLSRLMKDELFFSSSHFDWEQYHEGAPPPSQQINDTFLNMKAWISLCLFLNFSNGFLHFEQIRRRHIRFHTADLGQSNETNPPSLQEVQERKRLKLKRELKDLGEQSDRGFRATLKEQNEVRQLIFQLAALNPTPAPAEAYFSTTDATNTGVASARGKWTLIFTDAPDITSLKSPFNTLAELGRIGQECEPPTITKVIEWKAPDWVLQSPFVLDLWKGRIDGGEPRILQKVVTDASASPQAPSKVFLKLSGFKIEGPPVKGLRDASDLSGFISENGVVAGGLQRFPINLQGPLSAPFGEFEILYLDEEMRITRTGQNYYAVNLRDSPVTEWF
ncbi:hypothetical protein FisN_2Lh260 [Fistulifera solaris]|uniref:Plastid lipid-associated protein/fibrillin conserved domain-containing protein n=1 Tax=Fistulifera solaris TaxID=1519565 RepID=A0A1Z5KFX8_FISSO|nr:hypothetical protein FisN_2Lh260 [Fistulifera solaris]|eukprot:GAX24981.1 hypothetical protein FisN_2Lh260 [Fistulifera solaris]